MRTLLLIFLAAPTLSGYQNAMEQQTIETGWRGSPEAWLTAAYELLLQSGVDSVKILPLARRLNLSRTSFYWFFKDREELLSGLLARWRDKNTGNLVRQANAYAESLVEGLLNVCDCWLDTALFDSKFEFAVRSWALQSPDVQAEVLKAIEAVTADDVQRVAQDLISSERLRLAVIGPFGEGSAERFEKLLG